jgi:hypothetical protein
MKNHEEQHRGYHRSSKSYWAKLTKPDRIKVQFGMYHPDGSTTGEMKMEWAPFNYSLSPTLTVHEDSWSVLALFPDLIQRLGEVDDKRLQEPEFCKILEELGFKDLTAYEDPYAEKETPPEDMITLSIPKGKAKDLGLI